MKIAYIADVHLSNFQRWGGVTRAGVNERAEHVLDALESAVDLAVEKGCGVFGILGDLFDHVRPEPQLIANVQSVLEACCPTFALVGNHDQSSTIPGDNAIAPLDPVITIYDRPTAAQVGDDLEVWAVPFAPGPSEEVLSEALEECFAGREKKETKHRHLCLHMGIADDTVPDFLARSSGAVHVERLFELMEQHDVDVAVAGDWHRHKVWRRRGMTIVQVGSLVPSRFPPGEHEHAHIGPMVIVDGTELEVVDVPGPRFYKARWGEHDVQFRGFPSYLKLTCKEGEERDAREWLEARKAAGAIREYVLDVDRARTVAAARTAAHEARHASSVDEAVRVFIESMPLGEDVDRQKVLRWARGFLGGAG